MKSCSGQIAQTNKLMKVWKKIIGCAFIIACATSSASAMLKSMKRVTHVGVRSVSMITQNTLNDLSTRSSVFKENSKQFNKKVMYLNERNTQLSYLQKEGLSIFKSTTIMPNDTLHLIKEKTNVAEEILDIQNFLCFLKKEDIIETCNNSINNKVFGRGDDLSAVATFVSTLVFSPPPTLQIGYLPVSSSLESLKLRLENSELMEKIIAQARENHNLSLVGQYGGGCGFY